MSFRTTRRTTDKIAILEQIESGDRYITSISRRTDIFDICKQGDQIAFSLIGYATDTLDAQKQMRENPIPKKSH